MREKKKKPKKISSDVILISFLLFFVYAIVMIVYMRDIFSNHHAVSLDEALSAVAWGSVFITSIFAAVMLIFLFVFLKIKVDRPISKLSKMSKKIVDGVFNEPVSTKPIKAKDEIGMLYENFDKMQNSLNKLMQETRGLIINATNGMLQHRTHIAEYRGSWGEISSELNRLLDAIVTPIDEVAHVLQKMSDGQLDVKIRTEYKGYFSVMKDSVNATAIGLSKYLNEKMDSERAAHEANLDKERAEAVSEAMMDSIKYASKIQHSILPKDKAFEQAFSDYSVKWDPRDIVGGDIYWIKNFSEGAVLCVCDCTGHGTPGALLTMLVASALDDIVTESNYKDTAEIIWLLEQRFIQAFSLSYNAGAKRSKSADIRDGCDLAVMYISKETGDVTISAGNTSVFICDGKEVKRVKGQKIFVGEGKIGSKDDIEVNNIAANPDYKYYIASDGLFDQIGGTPARPFGYSQFKQTIIENHDEKQSVISDKIWEVFEAHRGEQPRRDDFELITFKP
ncbi:MAG: SpoIIE family protein phosphatase [Oscillospiraceae bacterium]|nr:SpoIIE family protein phosphatase [Oscillospiraceae bacterium]